MFKNCFIIQKDSLRAFSFMMEREREREREIEGVCVVKRILRKGKTTKAE